jgi:hypothetical protein
VEQPHPSAVDSWEAVVLHLQPFALGRLAGTFLRGYGGECPYIFGKHGNQIVACDDANERACSAHDRQAPNAMQAHELQRLAQIIVLPRCNQRRPHQLAHFYISRIEIQRDDFHGDIAVSHDSDGVLNASAPFDNDYASDVVLAHQPGGV